MICCAHGYIDDEPYKMEGYAEAVLYQLTHGYFNLAEYSQSEIESAIRFASAVAGLTTTKHGAMAALPTMEQFLEFLQAKLME